MTYKYLMITIWTWMLTATWLIGFALVPSSFLSKAASQFYHRHHYNIQTEGCHTTPEPKTSDISFPAKVSL